MGLIIVITGSTASEKSLKSLVEQLKALISSLTGGNVHINLQISESPRLIQRS